MLIPPNDLARPPQLVCHSLSGRVTSRPELEIPKSVVGLVAIVLVVNELVGEELTAEVLLHDVAVLKFPAICSHH
jgi:hypothetical protein